jgi:hypothetical protein
MQNEIDRMKLDVEKNEGRWSTATYREKRVEISNKEDQLDVYKKLSFGGNTFKLEEIGYFCDLKRSWVFSSNISELIDWFDRNYSKKK